MFKKLQRTLDRKKQGKVPFKMRFVVRIKQVTGLPSVFSKARVQWARGQKVAMTQTVAAVKGVVTFNESLEQIATVYKDAKNHMESKEYSLKLQVPSKNDEEKMVTLGKADVDMAAFVSVDKGVKDASVRIPYKVGKDLSGTLTFSVSTELVQAGSRDLDGMTEATGVTGLSAGLSEDLAQDLSGFEDPGTPSSSGHGAPFEPHRASSSDRGAAAAAAAAARTSGKGQTAADIAKAAIQEKDLQLQRARAEADRLRAQLELLQEQQEEEKLDTVQEGEEEDEARGGGGGGWPSQEEWEALQREREELEQGLAKQREGEARLQAKLEELSASLAAATLLQQQEADKSGEKISELEEALQEARQASSAAEEADAAKQQLEEKVSELQLQLEGLEQEREELEAACSTQEQSQERLQALLEETKQAAEEAQEGLREREAEAVQLAEECSSLKEQLASTDTDLQGEKAAALTLGTQLASATQDADGLRERVAEMEASAGAAQEEKQEMQLALSSAETQYQLLEQDQAKALEELEQSRKDVQELRTKLARIGAATSAGYQFLRSGSGGEENGHAEDADEQGAEPGSEESAADMMQSLVADLQKEVDNTRSERDANAQELQGTRQQLLDLLQRSQAVGLQLEQSRQEAEKVRDLEAERGELERAVMSAESLVVERDSELQALRQHLDQTMEGKQAAEQQVDELTQEVSQLQEASAASMQQLDEIRTTLQDAEAEASKQEKGAAAALSDLASLQATQAGMLADMELANSKRSEAETEKQMLEEALVELEAQLGEEQAARERLEQRLREAADGEEGTASTQLAAELEERERRLASLEEELQAEREELQTQLLEARNQIMTLERGLAQSQQGQKDLQNENMLLQEELQRAGDEAYEISRTVQRSRPQTPGDALQDSAASGTSRLAREVEDMRVENDRIAHELVLVKLALAEKVEEELVMKRELHRAKEKAISLAHRATKWETAFYSKGR